MELMKIHDVKIRIDNLYIAKDGKVGRYDYLLFSGKPRNINGKKSPYFSRRHLIALFSASEFHSRTDFRLKPGQVVRVRNLTVETLGQRR